MLVVGYRLHCTCISLHGQMTIHVRRETNALQDKTMHGNEVATVT